MSVLIVDDDTRAQIARVLEFAEQPRNYYRPGKSNFVPGDRGGYRAQLNSYRCVFTIIEDLEGRTYRHLSVSVKNALADPNHPRYPAPVAAYTIAALFGFSGWNGIPNEAPKDWQIAPISTDSIPHVVMVQEIRS